MKFTEGKVIERFFIRKKGGKKEIVFRYPETGDARNAMKFINRARKETDFLAASKGVSLEEERKWLKEVVTGLKKRRDVFIFVEADKRIVGSCGIVREKREALMHTGVFGVAILQEYTKMGIGTMLAKKVLSLAGKTGIEVVKSSYFEGNVPSMKLHKKLGFTTVGTVPKSRKKGGKYWNEITLYKVLG